MTMIDAANKIHIEEAISLRCKYCAAPLDEVEPGSEYIKCGSCGNVQKMVDAKAFLDQIMGHVYSWVSSAIPSGFDFSQAANADPVARHNIFVNNVKPTMETEFTELRFNNLNLLAHPLIVPPFSTERGIVPVNTSAQVFEFNAKIKSVVPLAIDEPSRQLLDDANRVSAVYAYTLNNLKLLAEEKPERFGLMAANFNEAAQALRGSPKYGPLFDRFLGLFYTAQGIDSLTSGNVSGGKIYSGQGIEKLESALRGAAGSMDLGIMYQSIGKEISIARIVLNAAELAEHDPGSNPLATMSVIEKVVRINTELSANSSGNWRTLFLDVNRLHDIFAFMAQVTGAKAGRFQLPIAAGGGHYLLPFWKVDLPYSFKTGVLWMKKGVEAKETLLIPAGFVTDPQTLANPALAVTDVFRTYVANGIMDGLTGRETSISQGGQINNIVASVAANSVGSRKAVIPLSTRKEVGMLVSQYIDQLIRTSSKVGDKLKLSAPRVDRLIFIPGEISSQSYSLPPEFGPLAPKTIGRMQAISNVVI